MYNQLNFKKAVTITNLAIMMLFCLLYTSEAFAQQRNRRQQPRHQQQNKQIIKARLFGQVLYGPQTLPVMRTVKRHNQGIYFQANEVDTVIVRAKKLDYYSRAAVQLMVNGQPVSRPVKLSNYSNRIELLMPYYRAPRGRGQGRGRQVRSIQLRILGDVQLGMVGVVLKDTRNSRGRQSYPGQRRRNGGYGQY